MQRVIVILGVLLFPKALSALKCYECIDLGGSCIETQRDCPASHQCGASVTRTYVAGTDVMMDAKVKSCMPSAGCDVSGSTDLGVTRTQISTKCCSTALCKVQYPTALPGSSSSPNGKRCFTCTGNDCSNILSCSGDDDRCVSSSMAHGGNKVIMKGCVSKSLCVGPKSGTIAGVTTHTSCCEGDLCNSATSTAVGLLLLLAAPVVSVALFN